MGSPNDSKTSHHQPPRNRCTPFPLVKAAPCGWVPGGGVACLQWFGKAISIFHVQIFTKKHPSLLYWWYCAEERKMDLSPGIFSPAHLNLQSEGPHTFHPYLKSDWLLKKYIILHDNQQFSSTWSVTFLLLLSASHHFHGEGGQRQSEHYLLTLKSFIPTYCYIRLNCYMFSVY